MALSVVTVLLLPLGCCCSHILTCSYHFPTLALLRQIFRMYLWASGSALNGREHRWDDVSAEGLDETILGLCMPGAGDILLRIVHCFGIGDSCPLNVVEE